MNKITLFISKIPGWLQIFGVICGTVGALYGGYSWLESGIEKRLVKEQRQKQINDSIQKNNQDFLIALRNLATITKSIKSIESNIETLIVKVDTIAIQTVKTQKAVFKGNESLRWFDRMNFNGNEKKKYILQLDSIHRMLANTLHQ